MVQGTPLLLNDAAGEVRKMPLFRFMQQFSNKNPPVKRGVLHFRAKP